MEHTRNLNEWLRITLRLAEQTADGRLALDISFQNGGDEPHTLAFSNRSRKAELLGLRVFDEDMKPIAPARRDIISLKDNKIEEHLIEPSAEWVHRLSGHVRAGFWEFQGAAYKIPRSYIIKCHFEFEGVKSNALVINTTVE